MSESLKALRRANPRANPRFDDSVAAVAEVVRACLETNALEPVASPSSLARWPRRLPVAAAVAAATAATAYLVVGFPTGGPRVESAFAAVHRAATLTSASAEHSGTAGVRLTHNGEVWAAKTIRWHGGDLSVSTDRSEWRACARGFGTARCGRAGSKVLLVDGTMYGVDPEDGGWLVLGRPESIDPDSGTTPGETLAAVREDVGGATLRRITDGITGLTTTQRDDGSTVYSGTVAAGLIARERGFKERQAIRVLPFGYVAHDEAADPAASLDTSVLVGADGIVREITVSWGAGTSSWVYTVSYSRLGETPAPIPPANAENPLRERLRAD
jgi:hypothetical protein